MEFRKKPVVIEAWEFTRKALKDIDSWVRKYHDDIKLVSQYGGDVLYIEIRTLEGTMRAELGDYIIKGVQGEFYPCKPDIFEATYERVDQMATKDLSYFVKREHKNTDKVNKRIANKSKEIEKILKQQEKVILDRIDKFYQDFGDTYGVSEEQAKKLVSQFDVDTFKERARKYVETKDTSYAANYD